MQKYPGVVMPQSFFLELSRRKVTEVTLPSGVRSTHCQSFT